MIVRTRNSVYEVDPEGKRCRRLEGTTAPTPYGGADGEWKPFQDIICMQVGAPLWIAWGPRDDNPELTRTTRTSIVTAIEELQ